ALDVTSQFAQLRSRMCSNGIGRGFQFAQGNKSNLGMVSAHCFSRRAARLRTQAPGAAYRRPARQEPDNMSSTSRPMTCRHSDKGVAGLIVGGACYEANAERPLDPPKSHNEPAAYTSIVSKARRSRSKPTSISAPTSRLSVALSQTAN